MIRPRQISARLRRSLVPLFAAAIGFSACSEWAPSKPEEATPDLDGERINTFYTNEEIAYLLEIGLWQAAEESEPVLRRWTSGIVIGTKGSPQPEDLATINAVAKELDGLARQLSVTVSTSDSIQPNVVVYFVPRAAFDFIRPEYAYPDFGFTFLPHHSAVGSADVLVAIDSTTQTDRDKLIHRGLAAALGLTNLSSSHPGSVFFRTGSTIPEAGFSPIDRAIIELLYSSSIKSGMSRDEAIRALTNR